MDTNNYPRAVVRKVDGKTVLDDPDALAMISAVSKRKCTDTLKINADRVEHFKNRVKERGLNASEAVIVVINVDDVYGAPLAEVLMPGFNWQEIRDRGETPFARGLATRVGIQSFLDTIDKEASDKLRNMPDELAVIVVDYGTTEVFVA